MNKAVTTGSVSWSISASGDEYCHTELLVVDIALNLVMAGCELIARFPHSLYIPPLTAHTRPLFPTPLSFPPSLRAPYMYIKHACALCVSVLFAQEHKLCSEHSPALILYRCVCRTGANIHMFCLSCGHVEATERLDSVRSSDLSNILLLKHYFVVFNILVAKKSDHEVYRRKTREKEVE